MSDPAAVIESAFYDHEHELRLQSERRADDWGGDDLFAAHPRRRFGRRAAPATVELTLPRRPGLSETVTAPRPEAPRPVQDELTDGVEFAPPAAVTADVAPAPPAGRRTVTITGRPGDPAADQPFRSTRRRPPRTAEERIVGGRPDRVAAWAFALGMVLIAVAVSTAEAAPL